MEQLRARPEPTEQHPAQNGSPSLGTTVSEAGLRSQPQPSTSYEQWLSSLSTQHRELLENRAGSLPPSTGSVVSSLTPSSTFHGLEIGEISANLSDDMKEMTNCVRQAIRSSSLERKSSKEPGSPVCDFRKKKIIFDIVWIVAQNGSYLEAHLITKTTPPTCYNYYTIIQNYTIIIQIIQYIV